MNYRPITDFWILGRQKVNYYGAFPSGFLERARELLCGIEDICWQLPGGMVRKYNDVRIGGKDSPARLSGFGVNDVTFDLAEECKPDILCDLNRMPEWGGDSQDIYGEKIDGSTFSLIRPKAILIDLPYTPDDADRYAPKRDKLPKLNTVFQNALRMVEPGGRVGVLDYMWPSPGKIKAKETAAVGVSVGRNSRIRIFSVWKVIKLPEGM